MPSIDVATAPEVPHSLTTNRHGPIQQVRGELENGDNRLAETTLGEEFLPRFPQTIRIEGENSSH